MAGRGTADERRDQIRRAATVAFARSGLHGVSIDTIAREVGISEAYVFRLFGNKRALFIDVVVAACDRLTEGMVAAAAGRTGAEALTAMGDAYVELLGDRDRLLLQMQGFAACADPAVRAAMQDVFGRLWNTVAERSELGDVPVKTFVGLGMLMNTLAALDVGTLDTEWARAARSFVPFGPAGVI
ncbi:TetR/AcrR family transcriptional regulator [Curtobacterium sp. MCBD17_019]|uniref:TetR/AcrR family transcriptional regulator n=1 Tax=Curtobacterium sp. MCBD17_019 TaxID=2175669 RepID=UPI000DA87A5E|nr:TetR/AcrR family transcriptional regulator [Curtobacterium sp. MCBD17_019]PZE73844.1 TetR/AcrR family transcriptional regulator [Curtobacterium sp. MCBD17_019]